MSGVHCLALLPQQENTNKFSFSTHNVLCACTCCCAAVLGRGYNHSVDWWTLGVLMYVLLTARQPFSSPKTHDPMEVGGK
jgi:serine/threonine protein kinase